MTSIIVLVLTVWVYMNFWYWLSLIKKRNDVADTAWGLGFIVVAWVAYLLAGFSVTGLLVNILVTIWGGRLAWHIFLRNSKKPEDARYKKFKKASYLKVFMLQGLLLLLVSTPVILINLNPANSFGVGSFLGLIVWLIGFYFESTADKQLKNFLAKPKNKDKIMTQGLWSYSRHPNYFGEVTMWWGIFVIVFSSTQIWLSILGPATITFLILFVSGVPLLENKYRGRADFEAYKKKTSIFLPLPPKK